MLQHRWHRAISEIPREDWDRLTSRISWPFLDWDWLNELEESGSISPNTGWTPCHLTLHRGERMVAGAALYVKTNSAGEFVWDFAWADVARQIGAGYYPKLVGMSPATPSPGYRFLIDSEEDEAAITAEMLERIDARVRELGLHSLAFNWTDPAWGNQLEDRHYVGWKHQSYVWTNDGFSDFNSYLESFRKNQRRNIRREVESMEQQGVELRCLTGEEICAADLDRMYDFYALHNAQFGPWAAKYLNRSFFRGLHQSFTDRLLLCAAYREGASEPIAMSFLVRKQDVVYGRYWGAREWVDNLHFNACYYQPIRWAIENGVRFFDPGMGSSHKVRRGFTAVSNYSMHRFRDPRMQAIMKANIDRINAMEDDQIQGLNAWSPLKQAPEPGDGNPEPQP